MRYIDIVSVSCAFLPITCVFISFCCCCCCLCFFARLFTLVSQLLLSTIRFSSVSLLDLYNGENDNLFFRSFGFLSLPFCAFHCNQLLSIISLLFFFLSLFVFLSPIRFSFRFRSTLRRIRSTPASKNTTIDRVLQLFSIITTIKKIAKNKFKITQQFFFNKFIFRAQEYICSISLSHISKELIASLYLLPFFS